MKARLWFACVCLCGLAAVHAEEHNRTYTVKPGSNGVALITDVAKPDDTLVVNFQAAKGYILVSAECEDSAHLGWKKIADFTFRLTVAKNLAENEIHKAKFLGKIKPVPPENGGKGGGGGGKGDAVKEALLDWDMIGAFKILSAHEGVGDDLGRTPPAALESSKPGKDKPPVMAGEAVYNEKTGQFDGSFKEGTDSFTGQYLSTPAVVDPKTATPEQLGAAEEKPCPDGDKVKVQYVYFGCTTAGKIGGMAVPDVIQINAYNPKPSGAELRKIADQKKAELDKASAAEAAAMKKNDDALAAIGQAELELEKAVSNSAAIKSAQNAVEDAQKKLAAVLKTKEAIDKEWAAVQQLVKDNKLSTTSKRYTDAQALAAAAPGYVAQAQKALDTANANLAKAREQAKNDPAVKAAQKKLDDANAARKKTEAAYEAARKATTAADAAFEAADKKATAQEDIEKDWAKSYAGVLVHEQGHRRICYFYADKLTDMLNHLRAWGYAPTKERAAVLGSKQFLKAWNREVDKIRKQDIAMQQAYDAPDGSDHGQKQEQWDWSRLK
jgi:hypothetical protein